MLQILPTNRIPRQRTSLILTPIKRSPFISRVPVIILTTISMIRYTAADINPTVFQPSFLRPHRLCSKFFATGGDSILSVYLLPFLCMRKNLVSKLFGRYSDLTGSTFFFLRSEGVNEEKNLLRNRFLEWLWQIFFSTFLFIFFILSFPKFLKY